VLGIPVKTDPLVTDARPELVKASRTQPRFRFGRHLRVHQFAGHWPTCSLSWRRLAATSSRMDELNKIGERIWNIEREFNLRAASRPKDDTLPNGC